jgi:hypothetical protein
MHSSPVKYLILIEAGGSMVARMYDADRVHVSDIDASSEDVAAMTTGLVPTRDALDAAWAQALEGHNADERAAAQVFTLAV